MRHRTIIILTILMTVFCSMTAFNKMTIDNDFCKIFETANRVTKHNFAPADHDKMDLNKFKQIDSVTFQQLNGYDKSYGEQNYIYGQFPISKNRLGLICYNIVRECDDNVYYFSLHIIDSCSTSKGFKILTTDDHHSGIFYQRTSSFNKDFSQLTMTLNQTSEWVVGTDLKTDTLFTDIYRINLKSHNLDTLNVTKTFKTIKRRR